jgi:hypothetical protein
MYLKIVGLNVMSIWLLSAVIRVPQNFLNYVRCYNYGNRILFSMPCSRHELGKEKLDLFSTFQKYISL